MVYIGFDAHVVFRCVLRRLAPARAVERFIVRKVSIEQRLSRESRPLQSSEEAPDPACFIAAKVQAGGTPETGAGCIHERNAEKAVIEQEGYVLKSNFERARTISCVVNRLFFFFFFFFVDFAHNNAVYICKKEAFS